MADAPSGPAPVLKISNLSKRYGKLEALKPADMEIGPGQIVGLIGPNGAGKTTLIECAVGLKKPNSGTAWIGGFNTANEGSKAARHYAIQFQEAGLPPFTRLADALWLWKGLYEDPADPLELCREFGIEDKYKSLFTRLSGGQKRRAMLTLSFIGKPDLAILDEPTSGMDPASREVFWDAIHRRREEGKSVLVTSHELVEMDSNCSHVAIIFGGVLHAFGTAKEVLSSYNASRAYSLNPRSAKVAKVAAAAAEALPGVVWADGRHSGVRIVASEAVSQDVLSKALRDTGEPALDGVEIAPRPAGLEDIFLMHSAREREEKEAEEAGKR